MIGKIALAAIGALALVAPASAEVVAQKELIPLYVFPGAVWNYACSHAAPGSVLIANPNSGPGRGRSKYYARQFDSCHEQDMKVIGYVDTAYGRKSLARVEAQIDRWYAYYGVGIDGIFLDEMAHNPDDTAAGGTTADAYYSALFDYVKSKGVNSYVVQNPGDSAETPWQLADADQVVVYEGPFNNGTYLDFQHYVPPEWVAKADPNKIAMLTFATDPKDFQAACDMMKAYGAGWGFVEQEKDGYWYQNIPDADLDAVRTYCG